MSAGGKPAPLQSDQDLASANKPRAVFDESGVVRQTHVGGQALIEGVMMRGRCNWALAVRRPDGSIYVEQHELASGRDKNSWMSKPVVRGCTSLVESLALGFKAMEIAANNALAEPDDDALEASERLAEPGNDAAEAQNLLVQSEDAVALDSHEQPVVPLAPPTSSQKTAEPARSFSLVSDGDNEARPVAELAQPVTSLAIDSSGDGRVPSLSRPISQISQESAAMPKPVFGVTMALGVLLGIGIFVVLPAVLTNLLIGDYGQRTLLWNLVDGLIRVAVFVLYIWLIGRLGEIRRMFGYHGAEHRAIHCHEHDQELTVANAQRHPLLHVRCGTAFMLMTMIIAILVFTLAPINWLLDLLGLTNEVARLSLVIASRVILLPVVAGLSYELTVKWAGSHPEKPLVKLILWPGLQLQRLTTNAPDDGMVECAIAAMRCVLDKEAAEEDPPVAESAKPTF